MALSISLTMHNQTNNHKDHLISVGYGLVDLIDNAQSDQQS